MDYTQRLDESEKATLSNAQPYDEDAIKWSALRVMAKSDDPETRERGISRMIEFANKNEQRLREVIELQAQQIVRLQRAIREHEGLAPGKALFAPGENGHQPFGTGKSTW